MAKKNKLMTMSSLRGKTALKCQGSTPTFNSPRKENISDYDTRGIQIKNKVDAIRLATHILALADTEEMEEDGSILNITVYGKQESDVGYNTTVTLQHSVEEEDC